MLRLFRLDLFEKLSLQLVEVGGTKLAHRAGVLGDLIGFLPRVGIGKGLLLKCRIDLHQLHKFSLHFLKVRVRLAGHHLRHIKPRIERGLLDGGADSLVLPMA